MKTCKNCGTPNSDDAKFCLRCGGNTFEESIGEQTTVLNETPAQPVADSTVNSGEYYNPANQTVTTPNGDVYYQPSYGTAEGNMANPYAYTIPMDQTSAGKSKKGKGKVWAIIAAVVVVLGVIIGFGASYQSPITEGYETPNVYINPSINLKIDANKGDMYILSDSEKKNYLGIESDEYETFLYDYDTDEFIYVVFAEGNLSEATQNLKSLVEEMGEILYEGETNYEVGSAYELEIAGNTFTCVDISQTVENDPDYGTYNLVQTLCFVRHSTTFLEISVTVYPDETGHSTKDLIDMYISENE